MLLSRMSWQWAHQGELKTHGYSRARCNPTNYLDNNIQSNVFPVCVCVFTDTETAFAQIYSLFNRNAISKQVAVKTEKWK